MNKNVRILLGSTAMLALSVSLTLAQSQSKETSKTKKPSSDGVVVTVDPKTHHVRQATPEEIGALDKSGPPAKNNLRTNTPVAARKGMKKINHPTGAVGMTLDDSYMTSMTVTKDANGKLKYQCVDGKKDGGADAK